MRTATISFALAMIAAPAVAHGATFEDTGNGRTSATPAALVQTGYVLSPGSGTQDILVIGTRTRRFVTDSRQIRVATGARFRDGEMEYVEGPAWNYQASQRGPMFEVAALGGGMQSAPYLAHVAMNWQF